MILPLSLSAFSSLSPFSGEKLDGSRAVVVGAVVCSNEAEAASFSISKSVVSSFVVQGVFTLEDNSDMDIETDSREADSNWE